MGAACACVVFSAETAAESAGDASWLDGAASARAFHSVHVDDEQSSLSMMVRRAVVRSGAAGQPGCEIGPGVDAVVVHLTVASGGRASYHRPLAPADA